jgi:hypothetical protein
VARFDVLQANQFWLIDAEGDSRGGLYMNDAGNPCLALFDVDGQYRLVCQLDAGGNPSISLADANASSALACGTTTISALGSS